MNYSGVILSFLIAVLLLPMDAWAYLDPGAGSALLQGILGGIAAIGVVLKLYWHRILKFFGLRKETIEVDAAQVESTPTEKSNTK
jgi:hypothetical protein